MAALADDVKTIQPKLQAALGLNNPLALPQMTKIVVNVGVGELKGNEPLQRTMAETISLITGQKPVITRAKKAIAGFKLRAGDPVGMRVTLRGKRMDDFLNRIITYVLPRIRDFRGFTVHGFDQHGNFSFGLREYTVFPEVPYRTADTPWGIEITLVTTAKHQAEAKEFLSAIL